MKKVLAFGSFDFVHEGHIYYLKEAKKLGDVLYVIVGRDTTITSLKGQKPMFSEDERVDHVKSLDIADEVQLGYVDDVYKVLDDIRPDVICLGYDQRSFVEHLEKELEKRNLKSTIIRMNPYKPDKYKSSLLKRKTSQT